MFLKKKKKISLVEAQDLYAKNVALIEFLESKFSKEELTASTTPQEETLEQKFKRVWEDKILTQCDSVQFLDAKWNPTKNLAPHLQVLDKGGDWLFEYDPSGKNKTFWYSYHKVYVLLEKEVSSDSTIFQGLIVSWVETTLGIQGAIPSSSIFIY